MTSSAVRQFSQEKVLIFQGEKSPLAFPNTEIKSPFRTTRTNTRRWLKNGSSTVPLCRYWRSWLTRTWWTIYSDPVPKSNSELLLILHFVSTDSLVKTQPAVVLTPSQRKREAKGSYLSFKNFYPQWIKMESRYKSKTQVCEQNPSKINILTSPEVGE